MPIEQWLMFLFGSVSMFMYTLIILTLRKNRTSVLLGGMFFRIVEFQYFTELFLYVEFSFTMRFRKYSTMYSFFEPDSELYGFLPRIVSATHYYIKLVVYIGYIIFAVNRLSTAFHIAGSSSEKVTVWSTRTLRTIAVVQWTLPVLGVIPSHAWPNFTFYFLVTTSSIRLNNDAVSTAFIAYIDGICALITCVFCMTCYVITCSLLRKNWNKASSTVILRKTKSRSNAERGLLISAILSFLVLMLNTSIQIMKIVITWGGMSNIFLVYDVSYPMNDLMYSHFPWVLLVTSSVLRKQLIYDSKIYIRNTLKLDEASMSMARGGQGTTNQTRGTSK